MSSSTAESTSNTVRAALFLDYDNLVVGMEKETLYGIADGFFPISLLVAHLTEKYHLKFGVLKSYGYFFINARNVLRDNIYRASEIRDLLRRDEIAQKTLMEEGFELILSPPYGNQSTKNRADMLLTIDALGVAASYGQIEHFCIAAGDSDFTPLVQRLKALGKTVSVVGFRRNMSVLLKSVVDQCIHLGQDVIDWGLREPLRELVGEWIAEVGTRERLLGGGMQISAFQQALLSRRPGLGNGWFGFRNWSETLEATMDNLSWPTPDGDGTFELVGSGSILQLRHVGAEIAPIPVPRQGSKPVPQAQIIERPAELLAALNRVNLNPSPALRRTVVEWMRVHLTGERETSLDHVYGECMSVASSLLEMQVSKGKVRQIINALGRAGALVDHEGEVVSLHVPNATTRSLRYRLHEDEAGVRSHLIKTYVDAVRADEKLATRAPVGPEDAEALTSVIFGRIEPELLACVRDALKADAEGSS